MALAQTAFPRFPGEAVDGRTLATQRQVEELYVAGEYARALLIYENELAPIGDKYAQYMVGYMYLNGQGVERDPALALAWYRLAAERGDSQLVKAKRALEEKLGETTRSDVLFGRLWERYGDRRLLLELVAQDLDVLREGSASRLAEARQGATIAAGYFGSDGGEAFYRDVRERLDRRLQYLDSMTTDPAVSVPDDSSLRTLESEVEQGLKALNTPP